MPVMLTFAALFTIFAVFDSQASTPGKYWWRNPGLPTDIAYFFVHTLIGSYFRLPVLVLVVFVLSRTMTTAEINDYFTNGRGLFADLPFWAQVVVYLLLTDFLLYWIHRGFHRNLMWKFHAIHHSSKQVDWTTAIRFHPINLMLQSSFVMGLMLSLGIKPEVIALVAPFDAFLAVWQHSNTKWKLGPLKYVLATPVFHRWHHTLPEEGGDMNFAPTFAFWDLAFGTFYMPEGKLPQTFGVEDPELREGYIAQFLYPFRSLLPVSASPQAHKPEPPVR
ncbi:MAG: sterol desaturase family protein [Hyphomicrobiaceae bacterium]